MKKAIPFLLFGLILCSGFTCNTKKPQIEKRILAKDSTNVRLQQQLTAVKKFVDGNSKYNSDVAFFIDMRISSAKKRFFVYDLKTMQVLNKGLVGHGTGSETGIQGELKFSNVKNSHASSLGKYAIGISYKGSFGKAYKLHGLDVTNSNAYVRNVVLHQYSGVPYHEQLYEIANSYGCPMVNEVFFSEIEKIIDASEKKIILSIFY